MPDSDPVASGVPMDVTQSLGSQSQGQITGQIAPGGTPGRGTSDNDGFSHNGSKQSMVKYGELIILGYNGQLPQGNNNVNNIHSFKILTIDIALLRQYLSFQLSKIIGDRGRRRSKFVLYRRAKANGIVRSRHYKVFELECVQLHRIILLCIIPLYSIFPTL